MRAAAGGNETGLKKFLLKYPSLFTVNGNMVSLYDSSKAAPQTTITHDDDDGNAPAVLRSLPDVSAEMEAVRYFQYKLSKKEERWVPIKSLAGHLSQAEANIRNTVGPQLDFRKWLLKHPHIFEVQGELVGLRDGIAAVATPTVSRRNIENLNLHNGVELVSPREIPQYREIPAYRTSGSVPKTPPAQRKFPPKSPAMVRRSQSFSERRVNAIQSSTTPDLPPPPTTPTSRRRNAPVTMTANEYKAVMFLKDIIEKKGGIKLHNITGHFSQAAEGVRNTIGWTKMELEEFLKKNANVFHVDEEEVVTVIKNAKMNVIITGSRPTGQSVRTLTGRKGKVFHVAKLWGIIDLGKHEHVFFDKSIMKKPIDDLQKEYQVGETLCFNAVLALKTSRAKWRATSVWKEFESPPFADSETTYNMLSPATSIEDEINRFLPTSDYDCDKYSDATPSSAGNVPVWTNKDYDDSDLDEAMNMMPETNFMSSSALNDLRLKSNFSIALPYTEHKNEEAKSEPSLAVSPTHKLREEVTVTKVKETQSIPVPPRGKVLTQTSVKMVDCACQTISTGEIIATQLYQEEHL